MKKIITIILLSMLLLCAGCAQDPDATPNDQNDTPTEDVAQEENKMTLNDKLGAANEDVNPEVIEVCNTFAEEVDKYVAALNEYNALTEEEQLTAFVSLSADIAYYNDLCTSMSEIYDEADENGLLTESDKRYWQKAVADAQLKVLEALANEEE